MKVKNSIPIGAVVFSNKYGIIGMTEIALQNEQTEEKRIDCLKKIQSSSGYLLNILNDESGGQI